MPDENSAPAPASFVAERPIVFDKTNNEGHVTLRATDDYWVHDVRVLGLEDTQYRVKVAGLPLEGRPRIPILHGQTVKVTIAEPTSAHAQIQVWYRPLLDRSPSAPVPFVPGGAQPRAGETPAADAMRCPKCGAGVKWSCGAGAEGGHAECQDGRMVSRRFPGRGEPCSWSGARVIRVGDDVVPDPTDPRWGPRGTELALP